MKKIKTALISVYHKDQLDTIVRCLNNQDVVLYASGGTYDFIINEGIPATKIDEITGYPSILGGRVKTLHPKIFGGILARRDEAADNEQLVEYDIPHIDLVIVDLYPFEQTVALGNPVEKVIEQIDIGGVSLIRAAAKNFKDVLVVPSRLHYTALLNILEEQSGKTSLETRKEFAKQAFATSSHYDTMIYQYFSEGDKKSCFRESCDSRFPLRYGENPHQQGVFFGNFDKLFTQLNGKTVSYNNLLDIDAAIDLINDFTEKPTIAIIKHNNACGCASSGDLTEAWQKALASDPVSAFGGIVVMNRTLDEKTAEAINKIFTEIVIAPEFDHNALALLSQKKNCIILQHKPFHGTLTTYRSVLNGTLVQEKDMITETINDIKVVTECKPDLEINDLLFANKLVKHTKSNAIVLVKDNQLIGNGVGETARVDALKHAVEKAHNFNFDLNNAVMASDALFPFDDCVEIAHKAGITAVIQPGGSIRDQDSIDYCNQHNMVMLFTGYRHFKH